MRPTRAAPRASLQSVFRTEVGNGQHLAGACRGDRRAQAFGHRRERRAVPRAVDWPNERRHPHPVRHRAGRPARRRAAPAAGLRRAAQAGRRRGWPRRSRARRSRPRPWSTRRTSGWWTADEAQHWNSRGHFFAAAAEAMRRILVDNARRKRRRQARRRLRARRPRRHRSRCDRHARRPARRSTRPSTSWPQDDAGRAELVKLRYFAGLTRRGGRPRPWASPPRPPTGYWAYARAWLHAADCAESTPGVAGLFLHVVRKSRAAIPLRRTCAL